MEHMTDDEKRIRGIVIAGFVLIPEAGASSVM